MNPIYFKKHYIILIHSIYILMALIYLKDFSVISATDTTINEEAFVTPQVAESYNNGLGKNIETSAINYKENLKDSDSLQLKNLTQGSNGTGMTTKDKWLIAGCVVVFIIWNSTYFILEGHPANVFDILGEEKRKTILGY